MVENISSKEIIVKIIGWKKIFMWITLLATILGLVVLLLIPKQYVSTTLLFPTRQFSVSKLVVENNEGNQEDYMVLGYADDCERLMQALNSDGLKMRVADHLDLWTRWKIKNNEARINTLKGKWKKMVTVKRTEFNSVKVEVHDYTANWAAQLANAIPQFADTVKFRMTKPVAAEVAKIVGREYDSTLSRMKVLEDTLDALRKVGVLHYKEMVRAHIKRYAEAVQEGDQASMARLQAKLDTLRKYGSAYQYAKDNLDMYSVKYPVIRMKYDEALLNVNNQLPIKFVIEEAFPNEFKAKPKRLIFLMIFVLTPNFIAVFVLLALDRLRRSGSFVWS